MISSQLGTRKWQGNDLLEKQWGVIVVEPREFEPATSYPI
jgi:hypothetical protein